MSNSNCKCAMGLEEDDCTNLLFVHRRSCSCLSHWNECTGLPLVQGQRSCTYTSMGKLRAFARCGARVCGLFDCPHITYATLTK